IEHSVNFNDGKRKSVIHVLPEFIRAIRISYSLENNSLAQLSQRVFSLLVHSSSKIVNMYSFVNSGSLSISSLISSSASSRVSNSRTHSVSGLQLPTALTSTTISSPKHTFDCHRAIHRANPMNGP